VRVVSVHADVVVVTSAIWQTTCTIVRGGDETFVIDSPVLPEELDALPAVLEQLNFSLAGLLATHADWDHLLARLAFPEAALGCAESSAARLSAEPGDVHRRLRAFDDEHYVTRPAPLSLGQVQALPVPGHCDIGDRSLDLYPATGHTADGMAIWAQWARTLVAGDFLSPVEIPMVSEGGSIEEYRATLEGLRGVVDQAEWVVPGHGGPVDGKRAARLLEEDLDYVAALAEAGEDAPLPARRDGPEQHRIHLRNVARVGSADAPAK
jgi:glyoxylase-like metal-dependent hydrolase (beta-lactamase superfamily II)